MVERPGMLVQEDKAPSYVYHYQARVYSAAKIARLIWPGNSPDLNAIKPAWPYLKRTTTKKGALTSRTQVEAVWNKAWKELP
jgi:transposase